MANWYATARSNYFRVKDEAAFRLEAAKLGLDVNPLRAKDETLFMVTPNMDRSDSGDWPTWSLNETDEDGDMVELDIAGTLAKHLVEDEIVVLMESGAEKVRYVTGHATAFNSLGKRIDLDLSDIYSKAAKEFRVPIGNIAEAAY